MTPELSSQPKPAKELSRSECCVPLVKATLSDSEGWVVQEAQMLDLLLGPEIAALFGEEQ